MAIVVIEARWRIAVWQTAVVNMFGDEQEAEVTGPAGVIHSWILVPGVIPSELIWSEGAARAFEDETPIGTVTWRRASFIPTPLRDEVGPMMRRPAPAIVDESHWVHY